jgi:hypothetical protein
MKENIGVEVYENYIKFYSQVTSVFNTTQPFKFYLNLITSYKKNKNLNWLKPLGLELILGAICRTLGFKSSNASLQKHTDVRNAHLYFTKIISLKKLF